MVYSYPSEKMTLHHHDQPPAYTEATAPGHGHSRTLSSRASTISTTSTTTNHTLNTLPSTSTPTPPLPRTPLKGHDTKFAMLSLSSSDRMRLIRFPEPITALASEVIQGLWPKGIQRVQNCDDSVEFKLRGNPLGYGSDEEKVAIRVTLMGILNAFAKEGWVVLPSGGGRVGRIGDYAGSGHKDGLIFHHQEPRAHSWLCISFDNADLLHLINAPTELAEALIDFFGERVEKCNKDFVSGNFEIKFTGTPWSKNSGRGSVQSRILILELMQCLEEQGYSMCTSFDIDEGNGGNTYQSNGELWFWYR
ncbi:uncharacterized protein BDV17DRAFT_288984 [Aspergillus undulatus]|uniref:uncharacterized protein n=1 Tax=Aspergillus undulatus TaxID=1810928 RepID=UPI003CCDF4C1